MQCNALRWNIYRPKIFTTCYWIPNGIFTFKFSCKDLKVSSLKGCILHRKNSLFYKTEHGAFIGDMFMTLIHTCNLMKVNPFDYLTTLLTNAAELKDNPSRWMPWNYNASSK